MTRTVFIIPGPEAVIWWGVHVPFLTLVFGVVGVLVGHWMAPVIGAPMPFHRQAAVIVGGVLLSLTITIAVGQRPMVGFCWSMGIGFSGIVIFQTMSKQAAGALRALGDMLIERLGRRKDGDA